MRKPTKNLIFRFVPLLLLVPFFGSCTILREKMPHNKTVENISKLLERNVAWSDENGIFDFTIQGPTNNIGYGTFLVDSLKVEGKYEIHSNHLTFTPIKKGYIQNDYIIFEMLKAFWKNEDAISLKLADSNKIKLTKYAEELIYIKKRKLSENELDAKYYFGSKWHDDNEIITFDYAFSIYDQRNNPFMCVGFYERKYVYLTFLENSLFSISFYGGKETLGNYFSYEDSSVLLKFDDSLGIYGLSDSVKLITSLT